MDISKYRTLGEMSTCYRDLFQLYSCLRESDKADLKAKTIDSTVFWSQVVPLLESHEKILYSKLKAKRPELIIRLLPSVSQKNSNVDEKTPPNSEVTADRRHIMSSVSFCGNAMRRIIHLTRYRMIQCQSEQMFTLADELKRGEMAQLMQDHQELQNRFAMMIARMRFTFGHTIRAALNRFEYSSAPDPNMIQLSEILKEVDQQLPLLVKVCSQKINFELIGKFQKLKFQIYMYLLFV